MEEIVKSLETEPSWLDVDKNLNESVSGQRGSGLRVEQVNSLCGDKAVSEEAGASGISQPVAAKKILRCTHCQYETTTRSHMKTHLMTHSGERPYQCDICPASFGRAYHLKRHMAAHSGGVDLPEPSCEMESDQDFAVSEEQELPIKEELYPYVKLEVMDQDYEEYNSERCGETEVLQEQDSGSPGAASEVEGKGGISPDSQLTTTVTDGPQVLCCQHCEYKTGDTSHMRYHLRTHTGERPFKCEVCSKAFSVSHHLKRHSLIHTGERRFKCDLCSASFNRSDRLKAHAATHTGGRVRLREPARCSDNGSLNETVAKRKVDGPFNCDLCSFSCTLPDKLKAHLATHKPPRSFKCVSCPFVCSRVGDLKRHMAKHTGERPFACDVCSFWCSESRYLKKHMATHKVKPFSCAECGYETAHRRHLVIHSHTHSGDRPYGCAHCDFRSVGKGDLIRHISRRHC